MDSIWSLCAYMDQENVLNQFDLFYAQLQLVHQLKTSKRLLTQDDDVVSLKYTFDDQKIRLKSCYNFLKDWEAQIWQMVDSRPRASETFLKRQNASLTTKPFENMSNDIIQIDTDLSLQNRPSLIRIYKHIHGLRQLSSLMINQYMVDIMYTQPLTQVVKRNYWLDRVKNNLLKSWRLVIANEYELVTWLNPNYNQIVDQDRFFSQHVAQIMQKGLKTFFKTKNIQPEYYQHYIKSKYIELDEDWQDISRIIGKEQLYVLDDFFNLNLLPNDQSLIHFTVPGVMIPVANARKITIEIVKQLMLDSDQRLNLKDLKNDYQCFSSQMISYTMLIKNYFLLKEYAMVLYLCDRFDEQCQFWTIVTTYDYRQHIEDWDQWMSWLEAYKNKWSTSSSTSLPKSHIQDIQSGFPWTEIQQKIDVYRIHAYALLTVNFLKSNTLASSSSSSSSPSTNNDPQYQSSDSQYNIQPPVVDSVDVSGTSDHTPASPNDDVRLNLVLPSPFASPDSSLPSNISVDTLDRIDFTPTQGVSIIKREHHTIDVRHLKLQRLLRQVMNHIHYSIIFFINTRGYQVTSTLNNIYALFGYLYQSLGKPEYALPFVNYISIYTRSTLTSSNSYVDGLVYTNLQSLIREIKKRQIMYLTPKTSTPKEKSTIRSQVSPYKSRDVTQTLSNVTTQSRPTMIQKPYHINLSLRFRWIPLFGASIVNTHQLNKASFLDMVLNFDQIIDLSYNSEHIGHTRNTNVLQRDDNQNTHQKQFVEHITDQLLRGIEDKINALLASNLDISSHMITNMSPIQKWLAEDNHWHTLIKWHQQVIESYKMRGLPLSIQCYLQDSLVLLNLDDIYNMRFDLNEQQSQIFVSLFSNTDFNRLSTIYDQTYKLQIGYIKNISKEQEVIAEQLQPYESGKTMTLQDYVCFYDTDMLPDSSDPDQWQGMIYSLTQGYVSQLDNKRQQNNLKIQNSDARRIRYGVSVSRNSPFTLLPSPSYKFDAIGQIQQAFGIFNSVQLKLRDKNALLTQIYHHYDLLVREAPWIIKYVNLLSEKDLAIENLMKVLKTHTQYYRNDNVPSSDRADYISRSNMQQKRYNTSNQPSSSGVDLPGTPISRTQLEKTRARRFVASPRTQSLKNAQQNADFTLTNGNLKRLSLVLKTLFENTFQIQRSSVEALFGIPFDVYTVSESHIIRHTPVNINQRQLEKLLYGDDYGQYEDVTLTRSLL